MFKKFSIFSIILCSFILCACTSAQSNISVKDYNAQTITQVINNNEVNIDSILNAVNSINPVRIQKAECVVVDNREAVTVYFENNSIFIFYLSSSGLVEEVYNVNTNETVKLTF